MATFLDLSLLQGFSFIFPVLVVFSFVFAILQKFKILGDKAGINAIVAVAASFLVLLSETARQMIEFMIPWFAVLIIFFVLLMLVFMVFGAKEATFEHALHNNAVVWTIIGIIIVIMLAAFGNVFGQSLTSKSFAAGTAPANATSGTYSGSPVATPSYEQNLYATLFHPKVLGVIILFAICIFAILLLSG